MNNGTCEAELYAKDVVRTDAKGIKRYETRLFIKGEAGEKAFMAEDKGDFILVRWSEAKEDIAKKKDEEVGSMYKATGESVEKRSCKTKV